MTKEDAGHYAKKHPLDSEADPRVVNALKQQASNGEVPCAVAFKIVSELDVTPEIVGQATDLLEFRLIKCQIGLFGYKPDRRIVQPAQEVSKELEASIKEELKDDRLPCKPAWGIAKKFGIGKMAVASACETLGIKINDCQLGAF